MKINLQLLLVSKGQNELLTYIPEYEDIFSNNLEEKFYIARLMMENLRKKKEIENDVTN